MAPLPNYPNAMFQRPSVALSLSAIGCMFVLVPLGRSQQLAPGPRQITKVGRATLNLSTGELVRDPSRDKSAALATTFANIDSAGLFGIGSLISSLGGPEEWLDWGIVPTDTGSNIIGEFDFGYGTQIGDINNGGPGAAFQVRFYNGATGFCADNGRIPSASFAFTGLPGVTVSGTNAWVITVDTRGGFEFSSAGVGNAFGFSVTTTDDDGHGFWGTGPIVCYAGDFFGGPDSNGQFCAFDVYDTDLASGVCLGTFFAGPPLPIGSWLLEMRSAAPDPDGSDDATVTNFNGTGTNPNQFVVTSGLVLGATFIASDTQSGGGLGVLLAGFRTTLVLPTTFGELLVNVADPAGELLAPAGAAGPYLFNGSSAAISFCIPPDLTLCGLTLTAQSIEFGNGIQLHNANTLTIGF